MEVLFPQGGRFFHQFRGLLDNIIEIPVIYTKYVSNSIDSIPDDYRKYFVLRKRNEYNPSEHVHESEYELEYEQTDTIDNDQNTSDVNELYNEVFGSEE